jgi:2-keto-4-pentenoate hydratase/2-oxohepta-3-ene-1,7-dioic acid hydratase in catechol pathway
MSSLRIADSDELVKVENVFCVGRNYAEHIKEMNYPDIPTVPVIFLKPSTAISTEPKAVSVPEFEGKKISENLQNELELVVVIGKDGVKISLEEAEEYIFGYCVGIDFTLRDLQTVAKQKGLPWATSKGFIGSAPVSKIIRKNKIKDSSKLALKLYINGEYKQGGNTSQMIFSVPFLIHYISTIFGLKKGDIIFTGTPAGVHTLNKGDIVEAEIENIGKFAVKID